MNFDLDLVQKIATFVGVSSIFLLISYLFKGIGLASVPPYERHLLPDSKKIMSGFLEALFPALLLGIGTIIAMLTFGVDHLKSNVYLPIFMFFGILLGHIIVSVRSKGLWCYYIVDEGKKLYIHKVTEDGDVVLSREKDVVKASGVTIQKKEFLYGKEIRTERRDEEENVEERDDVQPSQ